MPGIIVGVDGSDHSRRALEWAVREAALRQAPLTVLTVHQAIASFWTGSPAAYPGDEDIVKQAREMAQAETDKVLENTSAAARPPSVTVRGLTGLPADALLRAAADADLLVVGSRGAGGFKRLLLGSVSVHLTHHARCPVVVIPAEHV
jgi:nucleotide-binding universal stress UspA family protein